MNLGIIGALVLLFIWAIAAMVIEGPGWVHLLLTIGVSLLIYFILVRNSTKDERASKRDR
jgi:uncharacterized membrane protein